MGITINPDSFQSGCNDAARDIAAGKPKYFYGTRGAWGQFCDDLMQSRFGIIVESTSCLSWPELRAYREGYNSTIATHVNLIFGNGAFEAAWEEVWEFRKRRYDTYFKKHPGSNHNDTE